LSGLTEDRGVLPRLTRFLQSGH